MISRDRQRLRECCGQNEQKMYISYQQASVVKHQRGPRLISRIGLDRVVIFLMLVLANPTSALISQRQQQRPLHCQNGASFLARSSHEQDSDGMNNHFVKGRREVLVSVATAVAIAPIVFSSPSAASVDSTVNSLEDLTLGEGQWTQIKQATFADNIKNVLVPASFATYASRFLIQYDNGVSAWWKDLEKSYSLQSPADKESHLRKSFGGLAMSIQLAFHQFVQNKGSQSIRKRYDELANLVLDRYGNAPDAKRQIGLLFALLPVDHQPDAVLSHLAATTTSSRATVASSAPPAILGDDLVALLPDQFRCARIKGTDTFTIDPPISLFEVCVNEEFGQTATATAFGPLASTPLKRDLPKYTPDIYAAFGISGAVGCALTHTAVIPLDVVKTRAQTDPAFFADGMLQGAAGIVEREGIEGLLLGAQATIAGYLWYGISVYPSYTFFKRWIGLSLLPPEIATVHMNFVALGAGSLAAVVASLGLTPLEACRIRTVAEPETYREIGLVGTANVISSEDPALGWRALYAGFPSLLTRQVIFGSVKFLAFEQACSNIFRIWPSLQDATWTSLGVSLVAGGISGALSSVWSQPADSVLTYVAQNSGENLGVIKGCQIMVEREGLGSLFRGLGSRCVWAGSIIAGQFLLYDVFRTYFGVSGEDLSQVFEVVIPGS